MKGMNDLLRQAQLMQNKMAKLQEELGDRKLEASSGGGMVRVSVSGRKEILSVNIAKEAVNPDDIEMLEDLVLTAVNEALRQADEMMEKEMGSMTGGMKIPGMF